VALTLGTPPQPFSLAIDTGSPVTWVTSTSCRVGGCLDITQQFDCAMSSTCRTSATPFNSSYVSGSGVSGMYIQETYNLGAMVFKGIVGLVDINNLRLPPTIDGILGLWYYPKAGAVTILSVLKNTTAITQPVMGVWLQASTTLGVTNPGGELVIGGVNTERYVGDITYVDCIVGRPWTIPMNGISIGNNAIPLINVMAAIDTGTSAMLMPESYADRINSAIPGAVKVTNLNGLWLLPCTPTSPAPITFTFGSYVAQVPYTSLAMQNQRYNVVGGTFPYCKSSAMFPTGTVVAIEEWIIGATFLRTVYSVYDFGTNEENGGRIGFATLAAGGVGGNGTGIGGGSVNNNTSNGNGNGNGSGTGTDNGTGNTGSGASSALKATLTMQAISSGSESSGSPHFGMRDPSTSSDEEQSYVAVSQSRRSGSSTRESLRSRHLSPSPPTPPSDSQHRGIFHILRSRAPPPQTPPPPPQPQGNGRQREEEELGQIRQERVENRQNGTPEPLTREPVFFGIPRAVSRIFQSLGSLVVIPVLVAYFIATIEDHAQTCSSTEKMLKNGTCVPLYYYYSHPDSVVQETSFICRIWPLSRISLLCPTSTTTTPLDSPWWFAQHMEHQEQQRQKERQQEHQRQQEDRQALAELSQSVGYIHTILTEMQTQERYQLRAFSTVWQDLKAGLSNLEKQLQRVQTEVDDMAKTVSQFRDNSAQMMSMKGFRDDLRHVIAMLTAHKNAPITEKQKKIKSQPEEQGHPGHVKDRQQEKAKAVDGGGGAGDRFRNQVQNSDYDDIADDVQPDYALLSTGARVIHSWSSPLYRRTRRGYEVPRSLMARLNPFRAKANHVGILESSHEMALIPDVHAGECWVIRGRRGQIAIKLARKITVTGVTIEYADPRTVLDVGTAPRQFELWGLRELDMKIVGEDMILNDLSGVLVNRPWSRTSQEHHTTTKSASSKTDGESSDSKSDEGGRSVIEGRWWHEGAPHPGARLLTSGEYQTNSKKRQQTFKVPTPKQIGTTVAVIVRIHSNWGHPHFTCVYRIQVHGQQQQ
ncbi:hypothetical protein BG004_003568, partial [Podila humilis]